MRPYRIDEPRRIGDVTTRGTSWLRYAVAHRDGRTCGITFWLGRSWVWPIVWR
ncbi:MAG TPA: hypothetical protein VFR11_13105 [Micromonosporaceae bacterium]|jgi:hypothetical protein|nr:hypothetical protein [Micromonosporaceae bacterium]